MASTFSGQRYKRRYSLAEVRKKLDESDEEICDDSDTDGDSNYQVSDAEPDDDDDDRDSDMTEAYDVADFGSVESDTEADTDVHVPLLRPTSSGHSEWINVADGYVPPTDISFTGSAGVVQPCNLNSDSLPIEFFKLFLTEDIIDLCVNETNLYASQFISKAPKKRRSRINLWNSTNASEMKKFVGLLLTMGIVKKPHIEDYWSTDSVLSTPLFNNTMSRDRFELLLKFWHFSNNEDMVEGDRLFKLRAVCSSFLERFQAAYVPGQQLSID